MNDKFEEWWDKIGSDLISPKSCDQERFVAEAAWNARGKSMKSNRPQNLDPNLILDPYWKPDQQDRTT